MEDKQRGLGYGRLSRAFLTRWGEKGGASGLLQPNGDGQKVTMQCLFHTTTGDNQVKLLPSLISPSDRGAAGYLSYPARSSVEGKRATRCPPSGRRPARGKKPRRQPTPGKEKGKSQEGHDDLFFGNPPAHRGSLRIPLY